MDKDCLDRTVKFSKEVIIWGCIKASGLGCFEFIHGTVNAAKYCEMLQNGLASSIEKLNYIFWQDSV